MSKLSLRRYRGLGKMNNKPLVSIFIAAYNIPDYTRKTLQSIVEQDYRPVEIVFSDDCSPVNLEPLREEFRKYESPDFMIRFFRQAANLRGADNMIFGFDQCTGKYAVNMPHDDWWTDKHFLLEAVELMEHNPDCYLCVANSILEKTDGETMIHLPSSMEKRDIWQTLPGDAYIGMLGYGGIGELPVGSLAANGYHFRGVSGGVL